MNPLSEINVDDNLQVLLVDDEPQTLLSFRTLLKASGFRNVSVMEDSRNVIEFMESQQHKSTPVQLVILDLSMPFISGKDLLLRIKERYPQTLVIIMSATNEIDTAVECMKNGAIDYLVKPVETNRFISSVRRGLEIRQLQMEVCSLKKHFLSDKLDQPEVFSSIVTQNKQMFSIFKYIEAVSKSPQPIIITGETGVGKELIARAIHMSSRPGHAFVAVNVAGLDDNMFSDTLFGHKKGAFTSAESAREGLITTAANGTLFLDEIGDLNVQSQIKLMRLIQENEYYSLGTDIPKKSNSHIIVATNQDLEKLMENNQFRKDLYYRLCAHHIHVPPLRDRKEDIPLLVDHFVKTASETLHKKPPVVPPQLITLLNTYDFPGNIRQLQSLIYDAVSRHIHGTLPLDVFKQSIKTGKDDSQSHRIDLLNSENTGNSLTPPSIEPVFGRFPTIKEMEDALIEEALKKTNGNQGIAASFLGITRQALNKRLNRKKNP